jgi:Tol biopolymer transport system component
MWLFWLAGALVIGAGLRRDGEPEPRFLVATGSAIEVWHGPQRESTLLSMENATIYDAALSQDGTQVAFVAISVPKSQDDPEYGANLYVVNRDGGVPRLLLRHSVFAEYLETPVWLPGGREIACAIFTPRGEEVDVRVEAIDVASGARRRLLDHASQPSLMPDGTLMVLMPDPGAAGSGEKPGLLDLTTGHLSNVRRYNMQLTYINGFTLSPDGRQVAFAAADPLARAPLVTPLRGMGVRARTHPIYQDIWLMGADGSNLRRLADLGVDQPSIVWSADGVFIYAASARGFWRIDARTGVYRQIGPGIQNGRVKLLPPR